MNGNQQMLQIGLRYDRWAVGNPLIVPANPPVTAPPTKGPAHRYSPRDEDEEEEEDEDEEDEQDSEEAEEEEDEDS